jgi:hypothetical protein
MKVAALTVLTCCLFCQTVVHQDVVLKGDPPTILWQGIRRELSGPRGREYFQQSMKDAMLPVLYGALVSSTPADHPNTFLIAMVDGDVPEVTLKLKESLKKPLPPGTPVKFQGIAEAFTSEPFMLIFQGCTVDRATRRNRR